MRVKPLTRRTGSLLATAALCCLLGTAANAQDAPGAERPAASTLSQAPEDASPTSTPTTGAVQSRSSLRKSLPLPVDIPRIEREAPREPALKLDEDRIRYYVLIVGRQPPKWEDIVGDYDLMNGPTRGGAAMTHKEFLEMVTPKELNELFNATNGSSLALAQAAITNAVGQALLKKAITAIRSAHSESEVRAIRQQIDRELAALQGKGQ